MEHESPDLLEGEVAGSTPEDVAVLYSWANLQNAKYRDFSAARREYRAAMRHRAAEEQRLSEAAAQAEAEQAASEAELAAREAEEAARFHETAARKAAAARHPVDREAEEAAQARALNHAREMSRIAAAERIEAARRAEAVAAAEAASRRESREMEEARISAEKQAARYAESEYRSRELSGPIAVVPGQISDPYVGSQQTLPGRIFHQPTVPDEEALPARHIHGGQRLILPRPDMEHGRLSGEPVEFIGTGDLRHDADIAAHGTNAIVQASTKPRSGVRTLYSEPDSIETRAAVDEFARRSRGNPARAHRAIEVQEITRLSSSAVPILRDSDIGPAYLPPPRVSSEARSVQPDLPKAVPATPRRIPEYSERDDSPAASSMLGLVAAKPIQFDSSKDRGPHRTTGLLGLDLDVEPDEVAPTAPPARPVEASRPVEPPRRLESVETPTRQRVLPQPPAPAPIAPAPARLPAQLVPEPSLPPVAAPSEPSAQQRAYAAAKAEAAAKSAQAQAAATRKIHGYAPDEASGFFAAYGSARAQQVAVPPAPQPEPAVPAWLDSAATRADTLAQSDLPSRRKSAPSSGSIPVAAPADSLQASRERVASRWYALKGVFDHGLQDIDLENDRRNDDEKQAPIVAVFSLAGGVGKTSMVATLGRALSSTGEKVLLTDTTSHGLLPFYFGASELRPGVMRTFSPPSGSGDAAICLLSYDVLQRSGDQASQEWFAAEMRSKSKGMARVLLDLSSSAPWVARRMSRMDATVLIPLAPDMNSVISLGAIEKFFSGMKDSAGKPVQPFYVMNMFDSSLPLHLDVREVLRQQLGDRLLPLSIRRSTTLPEALAEGMTVIDYAGDSAVAEDYRSLGSWLKSRAAPALPPNSTARWSER